MLGMTIFYIKGGVMLSDFYNDMKETLLEHDYKEAFEGFNEAEATARSKEIFLAFLNFQDPEGKTLIHHIVENPNDGIRESIWAVFELVHRGADINVRDSRGYTCLHSCVEFYANLSKLIEPNNTIKEDIDADKKRFLGAVRAQYKEGAPLMHSIVQATRADMGLLLLWGADPSLKDNQGRTAWDLMSQTIISKLGRDTTYPAADVQSCRDAGWRRADGKIPYLKEWAKNGEAWANNKKAELENQQPSVAHTAKLTTQPQQNQSSGCVLF
jgi:ankyrin repeat protein